MRNKGCDGGANLVSYVGNLGTVLTWFNGIASGTYTMFTLEK